MNIGLAIILIIVAAVAGYIFGIVDSRFTASLKKKDEKEVKPIEQNTPPVAQESSHSGEHTVLRVTVDQEFRWQYDLDGVRLNNSDPLNPEQRQRMIDIITKLRPVLDDKSIKSVTIDPTKAAEPAPTPQINALAEPSTPVNTTSVKINPVRGIKSLLENEVKARVEVHPPSIIKMIDDVLQTKLPGAGLADKKIRLMEGPSGEVIVCVGVQRYVGIDAVPEPEIRDIIKSAISDWDKR